MQRIKFRCNKYSPAVLYIMVICGVALGFGIYAEILISSGIAKGPEYAPLYFREHTDHAVYLMLALLPVVMLIPAWLAAKCWGSKEEEAQLKLYEDHAILYFGSKEVRIEKGELRIKTPKLQPHWYTVYVLKAPEYRIVLVASVKELKEKSGSGISLDIAMDRLSYYKKLKKGEQEERTRVDFYGIQIALGITTPLVFDGSPYYVDYESRVSLLDVPFVTCMIRERKNPVHVVGDMVIDIRFLEGDDFDETNLKQQAILEIIELDEQIEC